MEGVEERAGDEVRRPDHGRGRDEEAARNAANGETDLRSQNEDGRAPSECPSTHQLSGRDEHPLIAEAVDLVVVHTLDRHDISLKKPPLASAGIHGRGRLDETYRVRRLVANVGHDGDEDMLLDGEGAGVDRDAKDLDVGHEAGPETTEGEGEQLGDNLHASRSAIWPAVVRSK